MSDVQDLSEELDERIYESVNGLAWLGHLEQAVEFCGHTFEIRTLKGNEELAAVKIAEEYSDTIGQGKAFAWAHLSLAIVAIDGDDTFCPPTGPDVMRHARARMHYLTSNWYWPVAEFLYTTYASLLEKQTDAIRAVQDLSQRSLPSSLPLEDSLKEQGDSKEI